MNGVKQFNAEVKWVIAVAILFTPFTQLIYFYLKQAIQPFAAEAKNERKGKQQIELNALRFTINHSVKFNSSNGMSAANARNECN